MCVEVNCATFWSGPLKAYLSWVLRFSSSWLTRLRLWKPSHEDFGAAIITGLPIILKYTLGLSCESEISFYDVESLYFWIYYHKLVYANNTEWDKKLGVRRWKSQLRTGHRKGEGVIIYRDLGHGANRTWQVVDLVNESRDKVLHNSWVCDNGDIQEDKAYYMRS